MILSFLSKFLQFSRLFAQPSLTLFIFSRDRPQFLRTFLLSFQQHYRLNLSHRIFVVYSASSDASHLCYLNLSQEFSPFLFVSESDYGFAATVKSIFSRHPSTHTQFLLDDNLFVRDIVIQPHYLRSLFSIVSLRLSPHCTYCYMQDTHQSPPSFYPLDTYHQFYWASSFLNDWSYPHSIDGNIFPNILIYPFISFLPFKSPTSLEQSLRFLKFIPRLNGLCFDHPSLINIPATPVNSSSSNRYNEDSNLFSHQFSSILRYKYPDPAFIDSTHLNLLIENLGNYC